MTTLIVVGSVLAWVSMSVATFALCVRNGIGVYYGAYTNKEERTGAYVMSGIWPIGLLVLYAVWLYRLIDSTEGETQWPH